MKIIDNAFSSDVFKQLQDEILSFNFPWHYGRRVSPDDGSDDNPYMIGWVHTISDLGLETKYTQELFDAIQAELFRVLERENEPIAEIGRIRVICNTKADQPYATQPHVDFDNIHQTALLYINDCDGDTIIYNEKYKPMFGMGSYNHFSRIKDQLTVKTVISPKANRLVLFDGLHYHSGTIPVVAGRRVIMNINYKQK